MVLASDNGKLFSVQRFGLGHPCATGEQRSQEHWHRSFCKVLMLLRGKQSLGMRQKYLQGRWILNHLTLSFVHPLAIAALLKAFSSADPSHCVLM